MPGGPSVQYRKSQNVPKITRDVESDVHVATLNTVPRFEPKHTKPLGANPYRHPGPGRRAPRRERNGLGGPSPGGVGGERDRARRTCRTGIEANERDGRAPLDVQQRGAPPAPIPERVSQQRPAPTEDEGAVRRQVTARPAELYAGQYPARSQGHEQMRRTAGTRVVLADLQRRLSRHIAAHRKAFAAAPERQRCRRVIAV